MLFWFVLALVVFQRISELWLSHSNAVKMMTRGGYLVPEPHYPLIVAQHVLFLVALAVERLLQERPRFLPVPFAVFLAAQVLRYWCIAALGDRWNTRVVVVPGEELVARGPYRWLKHPNYVTVAVELLTLPLAFGAYFTAGVFTLTNAWLLLCRRIPAEETALKLAGEQQGSG